ncbi:hypothetical protein VST7929_01359 [Vibrio stylophorae]|uniref:CcoQ/FixQ family Cbb3-type cytochrome c oxidase assembly chaperone n=1 Tax=Vibrio stylophorae TaxID=659351 RepID=A0ABM8ZT54_9VIBR|nr:cbb3-type cytochrome c oxidase subunit 3 [Vibrio stylophorae]CAH0533489.1 hypothetical protein VST7929_01359 [Vibrio stylophorae]
MITIHIIWTLAVMAIYLGIVAWAYDKKNKKSFDKVAKSILNTQEQEHD